MVMKHYPPEFLAEAVALYRSRPGATIKSVADAAAPGGPVRVLPRRRGSGSPVTSTNALTRSKGVLCLVTGKGIW